MSSQHDRLKLSSIPAKHLAEHVVTGDVVATIDDQGATNPAHEEDSSESANSTATIVDVSGHIAGQYLSGEQLEHGRGYISIAVSSPAENAPQDAGLAARVQSKLG